MSFIYKIINDINNKIYIGKTELYPPEKRWKEHCYDYKRRKCEKRPLYEAMNKYGIEHFHFEIIEETNNAIEREKFYIEKYRSYIGFDDCNGYNATLGGDGKCYLNLNETEVINFHINNAIYSVGITAKYFGVDSGTIENILIKNNIRWNDSQTEKQIADYLSIGGIFKVDINNLSVIDIYKDYKDAAKENNMNKDCIRKASNGKSINVQGRGHYYNGFNWYKATNIPKEIKNNIVY